MGNDPILNSPTNCFTQSVNWWFGSGKKLVQLVGLNMASYYFECFDNCCPGERVHFNDPIPVVERVWKRLRESGRFYGAEKTHKIYRQGLELFWDRLAVLREAEPAIAEIKGLGGDPRGIAKVWELAQFPDYDRWVAAHEGWLGVASEAMALVVTAYTPATPPHGAQPQPNNAQPVPNVLRERAKESLLRALGFQFNRHVRESSVALKGALAAEGEATVHAAWQALTQALPREGGPASLDELQERWAAAGRDVAGIDWATVHLRGMATGLLAAGNGQDGAQVGAVAGGAQKPTINTRMLELVQRDLARVGGWTAKQWAAKLRCAPSAVVATPTWKDLAMARERQKAERQADRRRRKRPAKRG